ncbi:MAG TPA: TadE/TadG family type IV pilus assembly protein [Dongiaceae bacterium]
MAGSHHLLRRLRRDVKGSIAVEAALILPVLTLLFVGAVDFGAAMMARTELFNAVHAGMLYALNHPDDLAKTKIAVQQASSTETGAGTMTVTATATCYCVGGASVSGSCTTAVCPGGVRDDYQIVNISATQTYTLLMNFPPLPSSVTLSENATVRTTTH